MPFSPSLSPLRRVLLALGLVSLAACGGGEDAATAADGDAPLDAGEVNVYSGRHYDSDLEIFDAFTEETGIRVNVIEAGGDALIERLAREGDASPADLFITADAGVLWRADERGVLAAIDDSALEDQVPEQFRHPEGRWFGLAKRARIIIYNREAGLPDGLSTYEDLADPAFEGMICIRPSSNVYNQSLLASIIEHNGEAAAEDWARGVLANVARKPQGNDTSQIEAVAAGLCRLGVVNSYYVARFVGGEIGDQINVFYPNQGDDERGAHVNISGAGVTAHAPNRENAVALLRYLASDAVQTKFALGNNEYPVVDGAPVDGPIAELGEFKADALPAAALGENQRLAVEIFNRTGWP
ncbi:MAG: Fe(3+) ABC transporter substrate-binding protein [Pseudomonadota bacterium]